VSLNLKDLKDNFRVKVDDLLQHCSKRGISMQPYYTLRTPFEQARLWRKSRTNAEVVQMILRLREKGADFLAHCLESVGPQTPGKWETDSPPGFSWHQWGEAVDCVWIIDQKTQWSTTKLVNNVNGYEVYAAEATKIGLTSLGASIGDWVHVQLRTETGPQKIFTLEQIDQTMEKQFG
jgi:peptidoglycan LD-endopeptidase CwlK